MAKRKRRRSGGSKATAPAPRRRRAKRSARRYSAAPAAFRRRRRSGGGSGSGGLSLTGGGLKGLGVTIAGATAGLAAVQIGSRLAGRYLPPTLQSGIGGAAVKIGLTLLIGMTLGKRGRFGGAMVAGGAAAAGSDLVQLIMPSAAGSVSAPSANFNIGPVGLRGLGETPGSPGGVNYGFQGIDDGVDGLGEVDLLGAADDDISGMGGDDEMSGYGDSDLGALPNSLEYSGG